MLGVCHARPAMFERSIVAAALLTLLAGCEARTSVTGRDEQNLDEAARLAGPIEVAGEKASLLVEAFAAVDAVDQALGDRLSVEVTNVSCLTAVNTADPLFAVPVTTCTLDVAQATPPRREVVDAPADAGGKALRLLRALEAAGAATTTANGKTGVTASFVACTQAPAAEPACTIFQE